MKTFLVKKDIHKPDAQDNWIIMNGNEFARFMETEEGQRKKKNFAKFDRCDERDDAMIVACGEKRAGNRSAKVFVSSVASVPSRSIPRFPMIIICPAKKPIAAMISFHTLRLILRRL